MLIIVYHVREMVLLSLKRIILKLLLHLMMMLIKSLFQKDMGILEVKWNDSKILLKKAKNSFVLSTTNNYL